MYEFWIILWDFIVLKQIDSAARSALAFDFEMSRAWFKRAVKREARARAFFEARIVALEILLSHVLTTHLNMLIVSEI